VSGDCEGLRRKGCEKRRTNGQESFVGGIYIDIDFEKSGEQTGKRARAKKGEVRPKGCESGGLVVKDGGAERESVKRRKSGYRV